MKQLVYVESSVISYMTAKISDDIITAARQSITRDWWENERSSYELCISALVQQEISEGNKEAAERRLSLVKDLPIIAVSGIAVNLAEKLIEGKAVPPASVEDALHIGIAAAQGAHYLVTWNFKHINNTRMKVKITQIIEQDGLICPNICSPEELLGTDYD